MICPHCAAEFNPEYQDQKYCSSRCRRNADNKRRKSRIGPPVTYSKSCVICGVGFSTFQPRQISCSGKCSKIHRRRKHDTRQGCRIKSKCIADYIYKFKIESGCSRCPEKRPNCLQFHHLDPSIKEFTIASKRTGLEKIVKEISKCIVLCGNCHAVEEIGDGYRDADRPKGNQCPKKDLLIE